MPDFYYSKNALMHKKDYKYISRKWENGHWVYEYPEPNKNVQRKSQKVASGNNLSNLIKVSKGSVYGKNDAYNALGKMKPNMSGNKTNNKSTHEYKPYATQPKNIYEVASNKIKQNKFINRDGLKVSEWNTTRTSAKASNVGNQVGYIAKVAKPKSVNSNNPNIAKNVADAARRKTDKTSAASKANKVGNVDVNKLAETGNVASNRQNDMNLAKNVSNVGYEVRRKTHLEDQAKIDAYDAYQYFKQQEAEQKRKEAEQKKKKKEKMKKKVKKAQQWIKDYFDVF